MKWLLLFLCAPVFATPIKGTTSVTTYATSAGSCPVTVGTLTLSAVVTRSSGISPLMVWYDATATTDSATLGGANNTFQDVYYSWTFGDGGASGTGKWAYGSNPNVNSKNQATGAIAAHLYTTSGTSNTYNATVTATDGTNTASCTLSVTAFDPTDATYGFAGTATTCVAAASTPVAGSGGCPAGAAVLQQSSFTTALGATYLGSGKRVLFKCGDTFTGADVVLTGAKWSVGAYGTCVGTQTNRPIINSSTVTHAAFIFDPASGDGRIADLDFEGAGTGGGAIDEIAENGHSATIYVPYQVTMSNLNSTGNKEYYSYSQCAQCAVINSTGPSGATGIAVFINYAENNPCATSVTNNCNGYGITNPYNNINYQALIGDSFTGVNNSGTGSGIEVVRVSGCRLCVFENNSIQGANKIGATLKIHNGDTWQSCSTANTTSCWPGTVNGTTAGAANCASTGPTPTYASCWSGVYTEYLEISDNSFGGYSGAQQVENAPQNTGADERLRYIVFERNLGTATTGASSGSFLATSALNETIRDNVFFVASSSASPPAFGTQICGRAGTINGVAVPQPVAVEVYNNTMYAQAGIAGQAEIDFGASGFCTGGGVAGTSSFAINNLYYTVQGSATVVVGTGNTVSNNTATITNNPVFTDGSGNYSLLTDFTPTANYTGGATVPNLYDALGIPWSPTWDLGAVHH